MKASALSGETPPSVTKANILDAAERRFAQYGLSKVTMDEIARDVGLGKTSLYYYFPTKESLFRAVLVREHAEFIDSVAAMMAAEASARSKLRRFLNERFEYFLRFVNLHILDLRMSEKMKPLVRGMFDDIAAQDLRMLQRAVEEGKSRGEFRVESAAKTAEGILHLMQGLRMRFIRTMDGPSVEPDQREKLRAEFSMIAELILRGLCHRDVKKRDNGSRTPHHQHRL